MNPLNCEQFEGNDLPTHLQSLPATYQLRQEHSTPTNGVGCSQNIVDLHSDRSRLHHIL